AVVPLAGLDQTIILQKSAALEARSNHPLAKAIVDYAQQLSVNVRAAADVQEIPGKGIQGLFDGERLWLGSQRLLEEKNISAPDIHSLIGDLSTKGGTVVILGNDHRVDGLVILADTVRDSAPTALQQLRNMGIGRLVMLTGDTTTTADGIGRELGMDEVKA